MRWHSRRWADRGYAPLARYHTPDIIRVFVALEELAEMGYQVFHGDEAALRRVWDAAGPTRGGGYPGRLLVVGRQEPGGRPRLYVSRELLLAEDDLAIEHGLAALDAVSDRIIAADDRIVNPRGARFQFAAIERGMFGVMLVQQLPERRVVDWHVAARSRDVGAEPAW